MEGEGSTPSNAAVASPGEMEGVIPDEEFPAPRGSVPVSDDGVPVPDEESSGPCDDFPPPENCPRSHAVCPGFAQMVHQPI